jgi:two-component system, OmpR family, sensor histidine kinase KdpD
MSPSPLDPDAEDQDRLKSELVATVSHEMRRPLTAILGFAQTLRTRWDTLPSQLRGELLERVELNAQAMSHMIGQVLDFSRLQLGQFSIELRPLEVEPLVARVLGNLGSQIAGHVVRTRGENDVRVLTEPYAFERILGNLVMNAAKFAPAGSTIEVGWIVQDDETVRLWVRDEGPGVPESDRERIFDRFYRVEHTGPGAGLGLAVVKELVLLHGGRVWMDSASPGAEGVGAVVSFTLPAAGRGDDPGDA